MKQHPGMKLLPISDAHQSSATQVGQVQNFIQRKVDVLIVSPNEPAPPTAVVEQACQAKIPVVILDRSVNTDCYSSFIGGDNYEIGKKAGEEAVKELPDGGNVVELRGILSDQPQIDRDKGFRDGIKANPKIKIVGTDGPAIPDGGIRAVQLGELSSTFVYPTCAKEAADTAGALAHGRQVAKKQTLHTTQVTRDDAGQLYKQFDMSGKIGG